MTKACTTCAGRLGVHNKTGYCAKCVYDSPGYRASQKAAWERRLADPVEVEKLRARLLAATRSEKAKAARSERCKRLRLWELGNAALSSNPEARARANRNQSETKLAGIPREVRDEYRWLTQVKRIPAPEARAVVLAHHEAAMAKFRRELTEARRG